MRLAPYIVQDSSTLVSKVSPDRKRSREGTPSTSPNKRLKLVSPRSTPQTVSKIEAKDQDTESKEECTWSTLEPATEKLQLLFPADIRQVVCHCSTCTPRYTSATHPGLVSLSTNIPLFETPLDEIQSVEEMTRDALSSLPRDKAIDVLEKYAAMKSAFVEFVQGRNAGEVIKEEDVRRFFGNKLEQLRGE